MPAVAQVADQVGQSAIEETSSMLHIAGELGIRAPAIGDLGQHSPAAFLREGRKIAPGNETARSSQLFAYQHSRGLPVADLARFGQRLEKRALAGSWSARNHDTLERHAVNERNVGLRQRHRYRLIGSKFTCAARCSA